MENECTLGYNKGHYHKFDVEEIHDDRPFSVVIDLNVRENEKSPKTGMFSVSWGEGDTPAEAGVSGIRQLGHLG